MISAWAEEGVKTPSEQKDAHFRISLQKIVTIVTSSPLRAGQGFSGDDLFSTSSPDRHQTVTRPASWVLADTFNATPHSQRPLELWDNEPTLEPPLSEFADLCPCCNDSGWYEDWDSPNIWFKAIGRLVPSTRPCLICDALVAGIAA